MKPAALRLLCLLLAVVVVNAGEAAPPAADLPATILSDLTAADAARQAEAGERQSWELEAQRLRLLADRLDDEVGHAQEQAAHRQRELAAGRSALLAVAAERGQLDDLHGELARYAATLRSGLGALARRHAPGAVVIASEEASPEADFDAAVQALDRSLRAAGQVSVEVIEGRLDGVARAVTMLRIAGVGWWCDLAGDGAGWVRPENGPPRLEACADSGDREAIRRAVAIAEGRRLPEPVRLPLPPVGPP